MTGQVVGGVKDKEIVTSSFNFSPPVGGPPSPSRVNAPATRIGSPVATYASISSLLGEPNRTVVDATATWAGLGINNLWSTTSNWANLFLPINGGKVLFPANAGMRAAMYAVRHCARCRRALRIF